MEEGKDAVVKTGYRMNESSISPQGQRKPKKMINQNSGVRRRDHSVLYCEFFFQNVEVFSILFYPSDRALCL